jgi:hypothetical protein
MSGINAMDGSFTGIAMCHISIWKMAPEIDLHERR